MRRGVFGLSLPSLFGHTATAFFFTFSITECRILYESLEFLNGVSFAFLWEKNGNGRDEKRIF